MSKYALCPGNVRSKSDGDVHFISSRQLARLYKVSHKDCIVVEDLSKRNIEFIENKFPNIIFLYPRYDGNYDMFIEVSED